MTAPVRVATFGAGYFSHFHCRAWQRLAGAELVAICDRDLARGHEAAALYGVSAVFADLGEMLDAVKPDVLDIVTLPAAHLEAIEAAAARGIDVICQKPFCGTLGAAERAVEIADKAGIKLIVHENVRFQPWYVKIRSMLEGGELGDVFGATFRIRPGDGRGPDAYLDRQPYFQKMPRFFMHETGIHYVDVIRFLFGEIVAVTARLRRINTHIEGEDAGLVIFEMADGSTAVLDGNRLVDHRAANRRRTMGEVVVEAGEGTLRLTGDGELLLRRFQTNEEQVVDLQWQDIDFGGDCVYATQAAALAGLTGAGKVINSARDYLANLRIVEAIYTSHAEGRRVALQQRSKATSPN